jgi:CRP-like cAMP-binding protein
MALAICSREDHVLSIARNGLLGASGREMHVLLPELREEHMARTPPSKIANRLLAGLPAKALAQLRRHLEPVSLPRGQVLTKPGARIDYVYFPESGMVSLVHPLADGTQIEVGVIGREGFVGAAVLLGANSSPVEAMVQIPGSALRMRATVFRQQVARIKPFSDAAHRYAQALHLQVSQTAACNGRHLLHERLARWLLTAHDRADGDELPLSHEFLSMMLGTRRVGVTLALGTFRTAGIIKNRHGCVTVIDRANLEDAACECYRSVREEYANLL